MTEVSHVVVSCDNVNNPQQKSWTPRFGDNPWLATLHVLPHIKAGRTGTICTPAGWEGCLHPT